jgi:hypothetical protein
MERERPQQQELSTPLDVNFDGIPQELQQYHQWVVWKYLVIGEENLTVFKNVFNYMHF